MFDVASTKYQLSYSIRRTLGTNAQMTIIADTIDTILKHQGSSA